MRFDATLKVLFPILILFPQCSSVSEEDSRFKALDEFFATAMPTNEPGGAVLIMKDRDVVFARGYGVADIGTKQRITPETLFNLGSVSKTFVANAILKLQEEGKLSVEDPILKYFPGFRNPGAVSDVRLKHLLTHTSGLPDNRNVGADTVFYLTAKDEENWAPVMNADSLNFPPGSRYEYSNPAFNALALVVEKVSCVKWQQYIIDIIMRPAGMINSTITDGPHPQSGVAHAYVRIGNAWIEDDYGEEPTFAAAGNGGVWSSAEELAKYELAIQNSVFLKEQTVADSRTVKTFGDWNSSAGPFIGWSWFIGNTDGLRTISHAGDQGGFLCNYVVVPEKDVFFVILCNTRRDVAGFTAEILKTLKELDWLEER